MKQFNTGLITGAVVAILLIKFIVISLMVLGFGSALWFLVRSKKKVV